MSERFPEQLACGPRLGAGRGVLGIALDEHTNPGGSGVTECLSNRFRNPDEFTSTRSKSVDD